MYKIHKQVHQALCSWFVSKISQLEGSALRCKPGLSKGRCASALWLQRCGMLRPRWARTRVTKGPRRGPAESVGAEICAFASGSRWLLLCAGLLCAARDVAGQPGHQGVWLQGGCASGQRARPVRTAMAVFLARQDCKAVFPTWQDRASLAAVLQLIRPDKLASRSSCRSPLALIILRSI